MPKYDKMNYFVPFNTLKGSRAKRQLLELLKPL